MRSSSIRAASALFILVASGCDRSSAPAAGGEFVGTYTLVAVNGRAVPFTDASGESGYIAGQLVLDASRDWQHQLTLCVRSSAGSCAPSSVSTNGAWSVQSRDVVYLTPTSGSGAGGGTALLRSGALFFGPYEYRR